MFSRPTIFLVFRINLRRDVFAFQPIKFYNYDDARRKFPPFSKETRHLFSTRLKHKQLVHFSMNNASQLKSNEIYFLLLPAKRLWRRQARWGIHNFYREFSAYYCYCCFSSTLCPVKSLTQFPDCKSHSRQVWSVEAVARYVQFWWNFTH